MNATEWLEAYADRLGVAAPGNAEFTAVLDLAGVAAHGSERVAAPIACWLAAKADVTLEQALEQARQVSADSADG
jgi:hypothetical protein